MTPQALTGLAVLLLEFREWLLGYDPGALDTAILDHVVDTIMDARKSLVEQGAR
jgi:hypothetical protein